MNDLHDVVAELQQGLRQSARWHQDTVQRSHHTMVRQLQQTMQHVEAYQGFIQQHDTHLHDLINRAATATGTSTNSTSRERKRTEDEKKDDDNASVGERSVLDDEAMHKAATAASTVLLVDVTDLDDADSLDNDDEEEEGEESE